MRTGRSAGGDNGTVKASLGDDIDLDGGVTPRVVDGAGVDLGNGHDESQSVRRLDVMWKIQVRGEENMLSRRRVGGEGRIKTK